MKLADQISLELIKWAQNHAYEVTIPNIYVGAYEMDMMCIKQTGYMYEYEIKVSKADFKNDFKKQSLPGYPTKHEKIKKGELVCNRFFFVVPDGLIKSDEVPDYAGLIYYYNDENWHSLKIIKNAKLLHRRKFEDYKQLCRKLSFREGMARGYSNYYKHEMELNKKRADNYERQLVDIFKKHPELLKE